MLGQIFVKRSVILLLWIWRKRNVNYTNNFRFLDKNWTKRQGAFSKFEHILSEKTWYLERIPLNSLPSNVSLLTDSNQGLLLGGWRRRKGKCYNFLDKIGPKPKSIFQVSIYPKNPLVLIVYPLTRAYWLTQIWVCYTVGGEEEKGKVTPQLGLMMYPTSAVRWLASGLEMTKSAWYFIWHMIIYWRIFQRKKKSSNFRYRNFITHEVYRNADVNQNSIWLRVDLDGKFISCFVGHGLNFSPIICAKFWVWCSFWKK